MLFTTARPSIVRAVSVQRQSFSRAPPRELESNSRPPALSPGDRTILSALHSHRMNSPLLPFVFDALASLIVGNQVCMAGSFA